MSESSIWVMVVYTDSGDIFSFFSLSVIHPQINASPNIQQKVVAKSWKP